MKKSDAFKLSTLATAMLAIMPALATATDPTEVTTPEVIKGRYSYEADADGNTSDWKVTAGSTTSADGKAHTETRKVNIVKIGKKEPTSQTPGNGLNGEEGATENVNMAGILVGVTSGVDASGNHVAGSIEGLTATYDGASINVDVETNGPNDVPIGKTIAAVAADGTAIDTDKPAAILNLGKKNVDGSYTTSNITLKATNNAEVNETQSDATGADNLKGKGGNAYAVHALDKAEVNIKTSGTLWAEATTVGNDSSTTTISGSGASSTATVADGTAEGGAVALYAKTSGASASGPATIDVNAGKVVLKANAQQGGKAIGIAATGAAGKAATVKVNGGAVDVAATASGANAEQAYAVFAKNAGAVNIGTPANGDTAAVPVTSLNATATTDAGSAIGMYAKSVKANTTAKITADVTGLISATAISKDTTVDESDDNPNGKAYAIYAQGDTAANAEGVINLNGKSGLNAIAEAAKGNAIGIFANGGDVTNASAEITADVNGTITARAEVTDTEAVTPNTRLTNRAYAVYAKGEAGTGTVTLTGDTLNATAIAKQGKAFGLVATGDTTADTKGELTVNANKTVVNATSDVIAAGIAALGGEVTVTDGDLFVNADGAYSEKRNAILVNGKGKVTVGKTEKTTQLVGDIGYYHDGNAEGAAATNEAIIAGGNDITVTLYGENSYWKGNAKVVWENGTTVTDADTANAKLKLSLSNGATWYATKVIEQPPTPVTPAARTGETNGVAYVAMSELVMDNGNVVVDYLGTDADPTNGQNLVITNLKGAGTGADAKPVNGTFHVKGEEGGTNGIKTGKVEIKGITAAPGEQPNKIVADLMIDGNADTFMGKADTDAKREAVLGNL